MQSNVEVLKGIFPRNLVKDGAEGNAKVTLDKLDGNDIKSMAAHMQRSKGSWFTVKRSGKGLTVILT